MDDEQQVLTESHKRQLNEGRALTLTERGVGVRFHKKNLADIGPQGVLLTSWLRSVDGRQEIKEGHGVVVVGGGMAARDAMSLLARGLILTGFDTWLTSLAGLVGAMEQRKAGKFYDTEVLVLNGLIGHAACPLTGWQAHIVEDFLIERWERNCATFVQVDRLPAQAPGWYSPRLAEYIGEFNREIDL